jgi:hypothetical protein
MKQFFFSALLLLSATAFSQDNNKVTTMADWSPDIYQVGKKYPGYIIKLDGDTVHGFLKADNRCSTGGIGSSNQNTAEFYLNEGDKKPVDKYKPDEIKGYKIADKVYESISYSGGLMKKPNFNLVVEDGAIRLYEWYSTVENYMSLQRQSGEDWKAFDARRFDTKLIVAKDPKEPIEYGMLGMSFAKKMPDLISDNPEMAKKVTNKEQGYKFLNMFEVIKEYNAWKAAN